MAENRILSSSCTVIYDSRVFVLQNVPTNYHASVGLLKDFIEGTLDVDVDSIITYPFIENRALVLLKQDLLDFKSASDAIRNEKLDSWELVLQQTQQKPAVVVTDINFNILREDVLRMYLERTFADFESVVKKTCFWPSKNVAVFYFADEHLGVVEKILQKDVHIPLPSENFHVKIHPFYSNFHDHIGKETDVEDSSDIKFSRGTLDYKQQTSEKNKETAYNIGASKIIKSKSEINLTTRVEELETLIKGIKDENVCLMKIIQEIIQENAHLKKLINKMNEENAQIKVDFDRIPVTRLQAKCLEPYMKSITECEVIYDADSETIFIRGHHHVLQKYNLEILKELRKVKEASIQINSDLQKILSTEKGNMFLQILNNSEFKRNTFVELHNSSLNIAAVDEIVLDGAIQILKEKVESIENVQHVPYISCDKVHIIKLALESKYLVIVKWDMDNCQLVILGIKDDVLAAQKEMEFFLAKYNKVSEKSFYVGEPLAKYFYYCLMDEVKTTLGQLKTTLFTFTEHQIAIRFEGRKRDACIALQKLENFRFQTRILQLNLLDEFTTFEFFLIAQFLKDGNMKEIEERYINEYKCLLDFSQILLKRSAYLNLDQTLLSKFNKDYLQYECSDLHQDKDFSQTSLVEDSSNIIYDPSNEALKRNNIALIDKCLLSTEIIIITLQEGNMDDIKTQLRLDLIDQCIHTDNFSQENITDWPRDSRTRILEKAKSLNIWLKISPHPETFCVNFLFKGGKKEVSKIKTFVQQEYLEVSKSFHTFTNNKMTKSFESCNSNEKEQRSTQIDQYWASGKSVNSRLLKKQETHQNNHNIKNKANDISGKKKSSNVSPSCTGRGSELAQDTQIQIQTSDDETTMKNDEMNVKKTSGSQNFFLLTRGHFNHGGRTNKGGEINNMDECQEESDSDEDNQNSPIKDSLKSDDDDDAGKSVEEDDSKSSSKTSSEDEQNNSRHCYKEINSTTVSYRGRGGIGKVCKKKVVTEHHSEDSDEDSSDDDKQNSQQQEVVNRKTGKKMASGVDKCEDFDKFKDDYNQTAQSHSGTSSTRGTTFKVRGMSRASNTTSTKNVQRLKEEDTTDEDTGADTDDSEHSDRRQGGIGNVKENCYHGRGSIVTKTRSGHKIESLKEKNVDSDINTDNTFNRKPNCQQPLSVNVTHISGRGLVSVSNKTKRNPTEQNNSTDDLEETDLKDNNVILQQSGPRYIWQNRGRGRGTAKTRSVTKDKTFQEVDDIYDDTDEDTNSTDECENIDKIKKPGLPPSQGASYRGRGSKGMSTTLPKKQATLSNEFNSNDKVNDTSGKDKSSKVSSSFRGRRSALAQTAHSQKQKSDYETTKKKTSEPHNFPKITRGLLSQIGRGAHSLASTIHNRSNNEDQVKCQGSNRFDLERENKAKDLSKLKEELERRKELAEEIAHLATEIKKIPMTELQAKCLQPYMKSLQDCKAYYDVEAKVAILKCSKQLMQKFQCDFLKEIKKLMEHSIPLNTDVLNILSSEKGCTFLKHLNTSVLKSAFVELSGNSLLIAALDEKSLNDAMQFIKENIEHVETFDMNADIPADKILSLKFKIEYIFLVKGNWDAKKLQLVLLGVKDDVRAARKLVEEFLDEYGVSEKSFDVGKPLAKYFYTCLEYQIKERLKLVKVIEFSLTEHQMSVRFQGNKIDVNQVHGNLEELKSQIKTVKWDLLNDFKAHEIFLIVNSLNHGKLQEKESTFHHKYKCLMDFSNVASFKLQFPVSKQIDTQKKSKNTKQNVIIPQSSEKSKPCDGPVYTISNTCQLIIKSYGDIVKEQSDVLVSVLGTDLNLKKTRVGGSFYKTCKSHQDEVKANFKTIASSVVTVKRPQDLNCLAVCHVVLEPWDSNTSSSKLMAAIQQVFSEAKVLGAKTVSIPPLGCGTTFQFPPSDVSRILFKAFQNSDVGSFLQKIVLLAPDVNLLKELKQQASSQYKPLLLLPKPLAGATLQTDNAEESTDSNSDDCDDNDFEKLDDISINKNIQNNTEIAIMTTCSEKDIDKLKEMLKEDFKRLCLHTESFDQDQLKHWPRESRKKIVEKAKTLSVWVKSSKHPKTHYISYLLKGEKKDVDEVKLLIQKEFLELSMCLPQKKMSSTKAPKRGTLEFVKYASESDEHIPSYWSFNENKSYWKSVKSYFFQKQFLVNIDQETKDAVCRVVRKTFDQNLVGQSSNAAGLNHSSIKVIDVQRVENVELFKKYHAQRKTMFRKIVKTQKMLKEVEKIPKSTGPILTTNYLSDAMKKELYYEINEHYLFHGTKTKKLDTIIQHGLDSRLEGDGIFGKGIYTAERSTTSDLYTDSKDSKLIMILCRVLLGNVFLCEQNSEFVTNPGKKLYRPPCMLCLKTRCHCPKQTLFDSVMGDGQFPFREFVVYEGNQCYPEYVITYVRE